MDTEISKLIGNNSKQIQELFSELREMVINCAPNVTEKLWAKMPSYTSNSGVVRLIPFKDHINIEAAAIALHEQQLATYKLTPKKCCRYM